LHFGVNAPVSSRYIKTTSTEFEITLQFSSLFSFLGKRRKEGREMRLKPKGEIRNEREIESERDERRVVEWTKRAGE